MIFQQNRRAFRTYFYTIAVISLVIVMVGWWAGSMTDILSVNDRLLAIGRLLGLVAGWSIVLELVLMSRLPLIERAFDLQEVSDLHRWNGYLLLASLSGHVAYLLAAYAASLHVSLWNQLIMFNSGGYEDVVWATIGSVIFLTVGALSVRLIRTRMKYEWWYALHLTMYIAVLLTFLHQVKLGGDFIKHAWFLAYWYALFGGTFVAWLWYRLLRPAVLLLRHRFTITSVEKEADGTYSVIVSGREVKTFSYSPGQYATWRILTPELWYESHPFSFSSTPGKSLLRFTVKASDDYMRRLAKLRPGSKVVVDGPRGSFGADRTLTSDVILIAGGIGVAPFISLAGQLLKDGKAVTLWYAVRRHEDMAFTKELQLLQQSGLVLRYFIANDGRRIDNSLLEAIATTDITVYICGPDAMSKLFTKTLRSSGMPKKQIVTERFAF